MSTDWTQATVLMTIGGYTLLEHPTRGDNAPVYMQCPKGRIFCTDYYDLEDFDLLECEEIAASSNPIVFIRDIK